MDPLSEKLGAHRAGLRCMQLQLVSHADEDETGIGDETGEPPKKRMKLPPQLPAFLHLSPPGPLVEGRDGRSFAVLDPSAVLAATEPELPMLVDWDHESMFGMSTKAAAWVDSVKFVPLGEESQDFPVAGFWGHVEHWTPEGADDVRNRRFRMLSPVIQHNEREAAEEGGEPPPPVLLRFENVALTNRPNLRMVSMNSEGAGAAHGATAMSEEEIAALRVLLGLDADADGAAVVEAVRAKVMPGDEAPPEEPPADEPPAEETAQLAADLEATKTANRVLTDELAASRAALAEHTAAAEAEALTAQTAAVDTAIEEGRANVAHRADLLKLATSKREGDREMFTRLTADRIASAPKGRITARKEAAPDAGRRGRKLTGRKAQIDALSESDQYMYRSLVGAKFSHDVAMAKIAEAN